MKLPKKNKELANLMNIAGRFKQLSVSRFLWAITAFEKTCQDADFATFNLFLTGLLFSRLHSGDAIVKKVLLNECPNLLNRLSEVCKNANDYELANHYPSLLRTISHLQFVPLEWFFDQATFIRPKLPMLLE